MDGHQEAIILNIYDMVTFDFLVLSLVVFSFWFCFMLYVLLVFSCDCEFLRSEVEECRAHLVIYCHWEPLEIGYL